jgi:DNA-binding HxlR family transcriptional regulator
MSEADTVPDSTSSSDGGTAPEGAPGVLLEAMAAMPAVPRPCPVAASLQVLGERWTLLAIREMGYGVHRFEQITRFTGASRDILTDRLRKLEDAGVVERRQYSAHPPRFEYHLTDAGQEARPVLLALAQWGAKWAQSTPTRTFAHDCGHPLDVDRLCHHCGGAITPESLRVLPPRTD